jgi:hypothetical protein
LSRAKVIYLLNHLSRFISLIFSSCVQSCTRIFNASALLLRSHAWNGAIRQFKSHPRFSPSSFGNYSLKSVVILHGITETHTRSHIRSHLSSFAHHSMSYLICFILWNGWWKKDAFIVLIFCFSLYISAFHHTLNPYYMRLSQNEWWKT